MWRAYPDYLPYFNEAVAHPERVLVDSDLDWGQDLYRLEQRAAQLHIQRLSLAYRGTADLAPRAAAAALYPAAASASDGLGGGVVARAHARPRRLPVARCLPAASSAIGKTIDLYYIP